MVGSVGTPPGMLPRKGMVCSRRTASSSSPRRSATSLAACSGSACWPSSAAVVYATLKPVPSLIASKVRFLRVLASMMVSVRASRAYWVVCDWVMVLLLQWMRQGTTTRKNQNAATHASRVRVDIRMVGQRNELTCRAVERIDGTGFDVIDPAMQFQAALRERQRHGRMRLEIVELRDHVLTHHRVDAFTLACMLARFVDELRRIGVAQPVCDGGHVIETLARRHGRHRTTIRMAADHDVGDA